MLKDENAQNEAGPDRAPADWGSRLRRQRPRPPRAAMAASLLLHALVIAGFWLAARHLQPDTPEFTQFRVTLVSPPPQVEGEPEPVETNTPVVAEPEPEPEPTPTPEPPKPQPQKPPVTQAPTPKPPEKKPDPTPAKGPDPKPVEIGGENMDVRIDGAEFAYPEYLQNITLQLKRYFRPPAGELEAEVVFYIRRDGSVGGMMVRRKSGNFNFDLQAMAAVEQAGRNKAFGPLPDGWASDRLWIAFTFEPAK